MKKNKNEIEVRELVQSEYRTYQLYTLLDRAIPYLRDGLKPSQRRILYTLYKNKNKGLIKVSSATGLVLSLHPHGPQSIESSIVNLAQSFTYSNNYPFIEGKGYFGERLEPVAAAGRYIECKLASIAEFILFDDLNQVKMVPNYDEKVLEPESLLPKLPLMLLNGAEGIGTGFSSMIPSFHHKDIIDSMIQFIQTGKAKKIKPWINHYKGDVKYEKEKNRFIFNSKIEYLKSSGILSEGFYITELPRGFDATKTNRYLSDLIDKEIIKDFQDFSAKNDIKIKLIFKKGEKHSLETVNNLVNMSSSIVPNYTLISDDGVEIFSSPDEIIELFTQQRLEVVKKRYELLINDTTMRINQNNEIIRFIKEKHYNLAEKKKDRQDYVSYLKSKKFQYFDYLADMSIYRMTKDEVHKRQLLVDEDNQKLKEYKAILKNKKNIDQKLIEELKECNDILNSYLRKIS